METNMATPPRCTVPVEIGGKICEFALRPDRFYSRVPVDIWRLFKSALRPLPPAEQVLGEDDLTGCLGVCVGELAVLNRNLTDHTVVVSREVVPTVGLNSLMNLGLVFNFTDGTFRFASDALVEGKRQRTESPFERGDKYQKSFDKQEDRYIDSPHRQQERYYEREDDRREDRQSNRFGDPRRREDGLPYQDNRRVDRLDYQDGRGDNRLQYRDDRKDDRPSYRDDQRDDRPSYRDNRRDDRRLHRDNRRSPSPSTSRPEHRRDQGQGDPWNRQTRARSPLDSGRFHSEIDERHSSAYLELARISSQQEFAQIGNERLNTQIENQTRDPFGRETPNPFRNQSAVFQQASGLEGIHGIGNIQQLLAESELQREMLGDLNRNRRVIDNQRKKKRCDICKKFGHLAAECRLKGTGNQNRGFQSKPRCTICNMFGHEAATCRRANNVKTSNTMARQMLNNETTSLNPWDSWVRNNLTPSGNPVNLPSFFPGVNTF